MWEMSYREAMSSALRLGLACSKLNSALAPTRKAATEVFKRIKLRARIWQVIQDELLSDSRWEESAHSTYFSAVCNANAKPLLYYDGPKGKWVCTARRLCRKLQRSYRGWNHTELDSRDIIDVVDNPDNLSIQVTTSREYPCEKLVRDQVAAEDIQLFPLADASVRVLANAIIMARHPWNTDEVFDFYSLLFKPMPEAAMQEFVDM